MTSKVKMPALPVVAYADIITRSGVRKLLDEHGTACAEAMREACAVYFDQRAIHWQEIADNAQLSDAERDRYLQLVQNDKDDAAALRALEVEKP